MTPNEHDEVLLELERRLRAAERGATVAERSYRVSLGHRSRNGKWSVDELPLDGSERCVRYEDALRELEAAREAVTDHERSYTGWPRYRLVISSDGHVHGDSKCRTFRETTKTVVIPALSGRDSDAAVEMLGNSCCSVCLPTSARPVAKISSSLVNVLLRRGTAAFEEALVRRKGRTETTALHSAGWKPTTT